MSGHEESLVSAAGKFSVAACGMAVLALYFAGAHSHGAEGLFFVCTLMMAVNAFKGVQD